MELENKNVGFALTGSFCTFSKTIDALKELSDEGANIIPIMSPMAYSTDTRFGNAKDINARIEEICSHRILSTIKETEPIGPKKLLDLLIVAPCTGNTLAKLASGIADTSVTMAVKAHLRNQRPVLLAVSTNDALANAAKNIGNLMNYKNIYFVPARQDDCFLKPTSVVADMSYIIPAAKAALDSVQLQPVIFA